MYLITLFLILCLIFIFQVNYGIGNNKNNEENINNLTTSNSLICEWYRIWNGGFNSESFGTGVAVDSLGNVYLAGGRNMIDVEDDHMVLVKYDENGIEQWNRFWGGDANDYCT
ncbi:MAG: SBBP repeat-containing protein, partial [Promethearchaeota archaeon]